MTANDSRLTVERVDKVSRRPWIFVSGRLEGEPLRIGDTITIRNAERPVLSTIVRSIEIHSTPGRTTIAIDASAGSSVTAGTIISRSV